MTDKELSIRWGCWLGLLACLIIAHAALKQNLSSIIAEKLFAPTYVALNDKEALKIGAADDGDHVRWTKPELKKRKECITGPEEDPVFLPEYACSDQPGLGVAMHESELVKNGHQIHRREFFQSEVAPHVQKVESSVDIVFVFLYGVLAMFPLMAITKWLKFERLPNARHSLGKIKNAEPPLSNITGLDASFKFRQVEKDFVTLKNLHDNGLITDEMFLKRKAELKAALDNNKLFNKDD